MIVLAPGVVVPESELEFHASRAGGPGGQNVNKVATRIELFWNVAESQALEERVRSRLMERLQNRLDASGCVRLVASEERSQARNREAALARLKDLIADALKRRKSRVPTKPTQGSKRRRLATKKHQSEIKRARRASPE